MTRDQIVQVVRDNLNDAGVTYYSELDITDSIQDGYDEIAVYSECIEKKTTVNFQVDLVYYDFSLLIPDYYRVVRIYSHAIKNFLFTINERENLSYRSDWELQTGSARDYLILGPKYIGISNKTTVSVSDAMDVWYKAKADILAGTDTPRINTNYQILLQNYATADLLEQNEEFTKANEYWVPYNDMLEKYRNKIQLLSKADRIFTRSEQVYY